jgi:hypothetical protein
MKGAPARSAAEAAYCFGAGVAGVGSDAVGGAGCAVEGGGEEVAGGEACPPAGGVTSLCAAGCFASFGGVGADSVAAGPDGAGASGCTVTGGEGWDRVGGISPCAGCSLPAACGSGSGVFAGGVSCTTSPPSGLRCWFFVKACISLARQS